MKPTVHEASVLTALSEAFQYNIADSGVIVQVLCSRAAEPTILFVPLHDAPAKRDEAEPDWRIEVRFPDGPCGEPEITTSGPLNALDADSPQLMLRDALLAASQRFSRLLHPPFVVSVTATGGIKRAYSVACSALPERRGAHWLVDLSKDLKEYSVIPGR